MIVLIIEDIPEEQAKAKQEAVAAGFQPIVAETLEDANRLLEKMGDKIVGIVTDIHFPQSSGTDKSNPNGLSVVSRAVVDFSIPVSVCTDIDHHYCFYLTDVLEALSRVAGYRIPRTLDSKKWQQATADLKTLIENKN